MKLNPLRVGISCGLVWGIFLFFLTLVAVSFPPYGNLFLKAIASVYPGYSVTLPGAVIGLAYGFTDGFFGGVIFAWVYNAIGGKGQKGK